MDANKVLNTLFEFHDELSLDVVFNPEEESRRESFTKAEALRELIRRITNTMPEDSKARVRFIEAVEAHEQAHAKGLFYRRNINLAEG